MSYSDVGPPVGIGKSARTAFCELLLPRVASMTPVDSTIIEPRSPLVNPSVDASVNSRLSLLPASTNRIAISGS